jgi:hypothetical protein
MAKLRKKYYSNKTNSFIEVPTTQSVSFNSTDIGNSINDETIRLIKYDADIDSSVIDETFADLLYNDTKLNDELNKLNSLLSDGIFYDVGNTFKIYDVNTLETNNGSYLTSFAIQSGQIKYGEDILFLGSQKSYYIGSPVINNNNSIAFNSIEGLSVGSYLFGTEFQDGTRVQSIVDKTIILTKPLKSQIANNSVIISYDMPTFSINQEIEQISGTYQSYPIYRRDVISYDVVKEEWEVTSGPIINVIPPTSTQLDALYQIESIVYISSENFKVKLKRNNRTIANDLIIGSTIKLSKTNNNTFDGDWEILSRDDINNTVNIRVLGFRNNSRDQIINGGFIDLNKLAIFSILIYKSAQDAPSLVFDSIKNISAYSGITGGVQNLIHCEINPDDSGYYNLKTSDTVHLVDVEGRYLDWEDGQDSTIFPELGYTFNENNLVKYDESQIPYDYTEVNTGNLSSIPFVFNDVSNDVFGLTEIGVATFNLGIKNNPISIGQEGITYRLVTFTELLAERNVNNISVIRDTNGVILKTTFFDPLMNFSGLGINISRGDFILITSGPGSLQIGKIINVGDEYFEVSGLYKVPTAVSKYIIFRNTQSIVEDSQNILESESVRSQVLSGINGYFGYQSLYSKVSLTYTKSPKIQLKKWYFLQLAGYNDLIENPTRQGTPYIIVEDPDDENTSLLSSPFLEVYYRTISGLYPNGNLLIEDEFGNVSNTYAARAEAPHFRPIRYQIIAKSLDENLIYPQDIDEVFVDVHTGKIKFHIDNRPRKVFVSYNKYDIIDGNSTDYNLKHIDPSLNIKVNLQDKITEIDNRLTKENTTTKTWNVNGLVSIESGGITGPLQIDPNNSYGLIYKDSRFSNHSFDESNYIIKLSNNTYDNPVYIGNDSLYLENTNFEISYDSNNNSFAGGSLITNFDFVDIAVTGTQASGITIPQPGINFYDEAYLQTSNTISSNYDFLTKKNTFEMPDDAVKFDIDLILNGDLSISGTWNYNSSFPFDKNTVMYSQLRTGAYENLLLSANKRIKRRFKQRETLKLLNKNMNDINVDRSSTKIISEKHYSKALTLDTIKYKENFLLLKSEVTKYKDYKFLTSQNLNGVNFNLNDITTYTTNTTISTNSSSIYLNSTLYTLYKNPNNSNALTLQYIDFSTSQSGSDITASSSINEIVINNTLNIFNSKIEIFNDTYLVISYIYQNIVNSNYELKVILYNPNTQLIQTPVISFDQPVVLQSIIQPIINSEIIATSDIQPTSFYNVYNVAINKLAIVWGKTANTASLIIYNYDKQKVSNNVILTDPILIESESSFIETPKICRFGVSSFIIAYSNSNGAKIKIFNIDGKLEFFNNENTIDYRTITNSYFGNGNKLDIIELDNNDVAIVYLEKDSQNKTNLAFALLDAYTKKWKNATSTIDSRNVFPSPSYIAKEILENNIETSIAVLNEDNFIVAYKNGNVLNYFAYSNDGGRHFNNFNTTVGVYSNLKLHIPGSETLLCSYITPTNFRYTVHNYRPDFTLNTEVNAEKDIVTITNNKYNYSFNYGDSNYLNIAQMSATAFKLSVISTKNKDGHIENPSFAPITFNLNNLQNILDSKFFQYTSDYGITSVIGVLYTTTDSIHHKIKFLVVRNSYLADAGDLLLNSIPISVSSYNKVFGELIHLKNNFIGIVLKTNLNTINIHGVSLSGLDSSDLFGTANSNNYTNSERIFNPETNVLSGVTINYGVSFVKKNDEIGALFYNSSNNFVFNRISIPQNLASTQGEINYGFISTDNRRNVLLASGSNSGTLGETSFVKDSINDNTVFLVGTRNNASAISGTVSGSGVIFKVNFDNNYFNYTSSSGTFSATSGSNVNYEVPFIENTNSDEALQVLFTNGTSPSSMKLNLIYVYKNNLTTFQPNPSNSILFPNNTTAKFTATKSDTYDIYFNYINSSSILKGLTLKSAYYGGEIEDEYIVQENVEGQIRNRLYSSVTLKAIGLDWRGLPLKTHPIYCLNTLNLDSTQIDSDGVFRSQLDLISGHLISTSKDSFSVVYYYHKDKPTETKFKLRNYIIARGRVFAISDWYEGSPEFSYENTKNPTYLQALHSKDGVLYVWVDPITKVIKKCVVDNYNTIVSSSFSILSLTAGNWIILGGGELIENWNTIFVYNISNNLSYTLLFNPSGELVSTGNSFTLPFDLRTTLRSVPTINKYGYYLWNYYDPTSKTLKYYQHGFDGDYYGLAQLVGKNYLTNFETTPDSPISKAIKDDLIEDDFKNITSFNDNSKALSSGKGLELLSKLDILASLISGTNTTITSLLEIGKVPLGAVLPVIGTFQNPSDAKAINQSSGVLPNSGVISATGFMLCDGAIIPNDPKVDVNFRGKYTPTINNERFIIGSTSANIGNRGGADRVTLVQNNIPLHNHTGITGPSEIPHNHSGTTNDARATYTLTGGGPGIIDGISWDGLDYYGPVSGPAPEVDTAWPGSRPLYFKTRNIGLNGTGIHSHPFTTSSIVGGNIITSHSHTISNYGKLNTDSFSIIPTYISAVYLIRVVN